MGLFNLKNFVVCKMLFLFESHFCCLVIWCFVIWRKFSITIKCDISYKFLSVTSIRLRKFAYVTDFLRAFILNKCLPSWSQICSPLFCLHISLYPTHVSSVCVHVCRTIHWLMRNLLVTKCPKKSCLLFSSHPGLPITPQLEISPAPPQSVPELQLDWLYLALCK